MEDAASSVAQYFVLGVADAYIPEPEFEEEGEREAVEGDADIEMAHIWRQGSPGNVDSA